MKKAFFPAIILMLSAFLPFYSAQAQEINSNFIGNFNVSNVFRRYDKPKEQVISRGSHIKDIQALSDGTGFAYTRDALFRTDDDGKNWREISTPLEENEFFATVSFADKNSGRAILIDKNTAGLNLAETNDGGNSWTKTPVRLRKEDKHEADFENSSLQFSENGILTLTFGIQTSSNFTGRVTYENDGQNWHFVNRTVEIRREDESSAEKISGKWILKTDGKCAGAKTGCVQETRIYFNGEEITPPKIRKLLQDEKENARLESINSVFARPPGGSIRISLNRGFDKCTAATVAQMQTWWDASPFYDANIYISGRNRGCSQPQLSAVWVDQVSAMGWGLIPTIVGYQAPCSVSTNSVKHSSDPAVAETQGRGEADIAINDANNLGLTQGTVLYYDMERYDETAATPGCRTSVKAFLKGWTDRLKERGYISGVYGSPTNAVADWMSIPEPSRMDAIWLARWDNVPSVWFYASPSPVVPENVWANHQRIKQWQAPHNETWGGVTFNIDGDVEDAPVAGLRIPKNKAADFDGDGKTDISVYRPESGVWYMLYSSNSVFSGIGFGIASDIPAPGDYDGDGKTDPAVFRPESGTWYMQLKAGFSFSRQFGTNGDIPVPADYNNDGKTDIAVFRPSNGVWYIANSDSRETYTILQFGISEDKPVPADYNGDGRADIAVWRPSNGAWYVLNSTDGSYSAIQFGISTDKPAQGDYDGDGKTDFAVLRDGIWYLLQTTAGFSALQFGLTGDLPVTGDFDGDNKSDIAVYRPSNGGWYLLRSQNGFTATGFGISTDKPIPNAYLPR